jgi:hypothetical protein
VRLGKRRAETVAIGRHQDEMHMVRHQAVGPNGDMRGAAAFRQQPAIERVVIVTEEDRLPPVAALRHMMRHASRNDSRQTRHATSTQQAAVNYILCPRNYVAIIGPIAGYLASARAPTVGPNS